jgi:autotransporter-associated beta strand protein
LALGNYSATVGGVQLNGGSITGTGTLTSNSTYLLTEGSIAVSLAGSASVGLTKLPGRTVTLSGAGSNTYGGPTIVNSGTLSLAKTGSANAIGSGGLIIGDGVSAATVQYNGTSSDMIADGCAVTINRVNTLSLNGKTDTIGALNFVSGGTVATGTGKLVLGGDVSYAATGSNAAATISGNLDLNATRTMNIADVAGLSSEMNISAIIADGAGSSGLMKAGAGTLTLTGVNTYSGGTTISAGALSIGNANALQNSTLDYDYDGVINFSSLTSATLGGLKGAKNLALANSLALTIGRNNGNTTYSGILSGNGSLAKTGVGGLTLTGVNTYTGGTTVSQGTLQLGNGTTANGSVAGNIHLSNSAALKFATAVDQIFGGNIDGNGTLSVENDPAATLTLGGSLGYTGNTTVNGGTLRFTSGAGATPRIDVEAGKVVFATTDISRSDLDIETGSNGTLEIAGGNHVVGNITGHNADDLNDAGTTRVTGGGNLTARKVFQDTLTLEANSTVTLSISPTGLQLRVFVNNLNLDATATLDLNDAGMILTNPTSYASVIGRIHQGFNEASGWWDGAGITSSVAKNDPNSLICLGALTGEEFLANASSSPSFLGKDVTGHANWMLIRPTVWGDSDFDGSTTAMDYGFIDYAMAANYDSDPNNDVPVTWMWGDYNYDGLLNGDDYGYIDFAYLSQAQYPG